MTCACVNNYDIHVRPIDREFAHFMHCTASNRAHLIGTTRQLYSKVLHRAQPIFAVPIFGLARVAQSNFGLPGQGPALGVTNEHVFLRLQLQFTNINVNTVLVIVF